MRVLSTEGIGMDATYHPQPPLRLRREFGGFRMEEQILVRVYELIVPTIRPETGVVQLSQVGVLEAPESNRQSQHIAKGA